MEQHEKERLTAVFTRLNIGKEKVDKLIAEVEKTDNPDLESLISEYDNELETIVSQKPTFKDKFVKPQIDEELQKNLNGIRGSLFSKVNLIPEDRKKAIVVAANGNFQQAINDLITEIQHTTTNIDEVTKRQIQDLSNKLQNMEGLLSQKELEAKEAAEKAIKSEKRLQVNTALINEFSNITPFVSETLNKDIVKKTAMDAVKSKYNIDVTPEGNVFLRSKSSNDIVFKPNTNNHLTIQDVMLEFIKESGFMKLSNPKNKNEDDPAPIGQTGGVGKLRPR